MLQLLPEKSDYIYMYKGLKDYRKDLLKDLPGMEKWFPEEVFDLKPIWIEKPYNNVFEGLVNTSGGFLAKNIDTTTSVMNGCASPSTILNELKRGKEEGFPYTHVGFSIYPNQFNRFIKCSKTVKEFNNKIITIAGNVGVLFDETKDHVDYVCRGNGVPFLRKLLGEDINKPYKLTLIPYDTTLTVLGREIKTHMVNIITKLGCPNKCDFCVTNQLFQGWFTKPLFTPEEVYLKITEYHSNVKKDFTILFCEATGIVNKSWWYRLFELFEEESNDYPIYMPTTLQSIKNLDFNRISNSALRFEAFNIGIESFSINYPKNQKYKETKRFFKTLSDYGIGQYITFIIGFDNQTKEDIWDEIHKLIELDA